MREIFADIGQTIRNQYAISYHPTNPRRMDLSARSRWNWWMKPATRLKMKDEKGKDVKYQIVAREGYKAKQQVE